MVTGSSPGANEDPPSRGAVARQIYRGSKSFHWLWCGTLEKCCASSGVTGPSPTALILLPIPPAKELLFLIIFPVD
ncbi:hypothetical protein TNCV_2947251 [Trichonephila clavipes]|nr:hypothetical protein TNCV_2947251 [Trichonephila clavipes]